MQHKERSPRNNTVTLTDEEYSLYTKKPLIFSPHNTAELSLAAISNRIICGSTEDILPHLPHSFVDLLIIDPPYNLDKNFNGSLFKSRSDGDYTAYVESWFVPLLPLLKPNASIYLCCDWKSSSPIYYVLQKYVQIQNRITWQREKGRGAKANWKSCCEDIWFATKSSTYYFNTDAVKQKRKVIAPYKIGGNPRDWEETEGGKFRLTYPSNFWDDISVPFWSMSENTDHPTQKPEKLLAKLILASSQKSDMIFDPFLGSGTSAVVAKKLERNYVGIERNIEYCAWAEKRLEKAQGDMNIQGYADGVFWERNSKILKNSL